MGGVQGSIGPASLGFYRPRRPTTIGCRLSPDNLPLSTRLRMLYFDHNATSPLSCRARQAWLQAAERYTGNPSSPHRLGSRAEVALANARERVASLLGCDPVQIVWTSGATEANNTVIQHFARTTRGPLWVSAVEHPCVIESVKAYLPHRHRLIPVTANGVLDLAWLHSQLAISTPAMIAVMAANNETGVLQPWRQIAALCAGLGIPFFCDAAQWVGKLPLSGLGQCEFVSGCAHKFGGPQGVGFLKCPVGTRPLLVGGPQEYGRRAGTENVPGVLAMVAALDERSAAMDTTANRETLRLKFEVALGAAIPRIEIIGAGEDRLWNTVAVVMPVRDCRQRWVVRLDALGFAASTGSACASGKEKPSHVLSAMGYSPEKAARVLRFSSGWQTSADDWDQLSGALHQLLEA